MIVEVLVDGARAVGISHKVCSWDLICLNRRTEGIWIRLASCDTVRDRGSWEPPDANELRSPFHRVHTATDSVQASAVAGRLWVRNGASILEKIETLVALIVYQCTCFVKSSSCTAVVGVQSHQVNRVEVPPFDDVDLSINGPSCAKAYAPESRPGTATKRHVIKVKDVQRMSPCSVRLESNALATSNTAVGNELAEIVDMRSVRAKCDAGCTG